MCRKDIRACIIWLPQRRSVPDCTSCNLSIKSFSFPYYRTDVLEVVRECQADFNSKADTGKNRREKAQLSQALLALLMYTAITPGRSKEYTTLKFEIHKDQLPPLQERRPNAPNCVHITEGGDAGYMALSDHKTSKRYGCDHIMLGTDSPLLQHMGRHLQMYRHLLQGKQENNFLFLVSETDHPHLHSIPSPTHTHSPTHLKKGVIYTLPKVVVNCLQDS